MLKQEVNELLTRTGPGTPTGDLFRRYWIPALLAEELPENDCPPVRVKILSERLIAFRDSEGEYGLDRRVLRRTAAPRSGSGDVEECGIRCAYHGWKYDADGQCLEVPSEPENSNFANEGAGSTSYPLVKIGDILWTYLGDPDDAAAAAGVRVRAACRTEQTYTSKRWQESNWLQALEGGIDSSHVSWLHSGGPQERPALQGREGQPVQPQRPASVLRGRGRRRRAVRRRPPQRGGRQVLLADHALGDAELHDGAAARRPPRARPLLGADRRRELLGLHVRLPPDARARGRRGARR